ncbi:MAG: hypothetical protein NZ957_03350 [Thaumarchaeota archaeon]|nr:hypothetical protein [Candidatus Calditenuaceae archaeon]MDW8042144.1 hypothetical protein [Nitrososphaerota archaeon]
MSSRRRLEPEEEARRLTEEGRVKRYVFTPSGRVVWVVVGRKRDYVVMPEVNYCTCDDYFFRVIRGHKPSCYHLVAVKEAITEGNYIAVDEEDYWFWYLIDEWLDWG